MSLMTPFAKPHVINNNKILNNPNIKINQIGQLSLSSKLIELTLDYFINLIKPIIQMTVKNTTLISNLVFILNFIITINKTI